MNLLLPMLIFSTVLPAFDSKNMASVLSVVVTSFFYQALGLCFGFTVRWLTPIPTSWRGGVLAAGAFSNVGDLIIAYISTVAKSSPFNPETDPARGTAYASILMVVQLVTIFNFGGYQLVKQDFDTPREPLPDTEKSTPARLDPEPSTISFADSVRKTLSIVSRIAARKSQQCVQTPSETLSSCETIPPITDDTDPITTTHSPKETLGIIAPIPVPSIAENTAPTLTRRLWMIIRPFITPPSIALVLSLIIANVPILKALFMENPDIHMPQAPDQRPPLDFLMEIAVFAGPTVPVIGMLLLGAALSRLSMSGLPKGFWKAAVMMAGLKLVVGPIIGIAWTTGLTKETSWIPETDKILQLVMILGSAGMCIRPSPSPSQETRGRVVVDSLKLIVTRGVYVQLQQQPHRCI
ncbi:Protein M3 [Maublancomyces gigas]|uniref:Protein M3 n=1 Tax=Discina gigas TaxID=1032678 RepID=A0ABR3GA92_9PEZI